MRLSIKYILFSFSFLLFACTNQRNKESLKYDNGIWEHITINSVPIPIELPQIYDINKMTRYGKHLLIQNLKKEPLFSLLDLQTMTEITSWGYFGNGPREFLNNSILVDSNDDYIRIYDNYEMQKYSLSGDSIIYIKSVTCDKEPNFLERIYAISDSLICGYKYGPREIGIHLMDFPTQTSFCSISTNEGYFDDKNTPEEFYFKVFNDKVIIGRKNYDQIEVYKIADDKKAFNELFIINYDNASAKNIDIRKPCYMIDINADDNYFYMLNQNTNESGKETYLDIYSWKGEAVKRIKLGGLYLQGVLFENKMYLKKYEDDDNIYLLELDL